MILHVVWCNNPLIANLTERDRVAFSKYDLVVLWALVGGFPREMTLYIGEVYRRYLGEWFVRLRGRGGGERVA
jgi:hypothetical protein